MTVFGDQVRSTRPRLQFGHGVEAVDDRLNSGMGADGAIGLQFGHGVEAVDDALVM